MYKISSWIVDVILRFWQSIPILVIHNLDKARTLKKVFWHLNVDGMEGDYIEFGVAHGHSMRAAQYAVQQSSSKSLGIKHIPRDLYGFDPLINLLEANLILTQPGKEMPLMHRIRRLIKGLRQ